MRKAAFVALVTAAQPEAPVYFACAADLKRRQRSTLTRALESSLTPLALDKVVALIHAYSRASEYYGGTACPWGATA
jgi:hypothetical protein